MESAICGQSFWHFLKLVVIVRNVLMTLPAQSSALAYGGSFGIQLISSYALVSVTFDFLSRLSTKERKQLM